MGFWGWGYTKSGPLPTTSRFSLPAGRPFGKHSGMSTYRSFDITHSLRANSATWPKSNAREYANKGFKAYTRFTTKPSIA